MRILITDNDLRYLVARIYFILIISFQLVPLFVIIGTGTVGAIAFTIRQAMKNPEARYV